MPGKIFLSVPGASYPYTPADVAGSTGPLTVLGGTLTGASTPVLNLTQTWNNAATTFTGELINITDTASNAASLMLDLQVGGISKFRVDKSGLPYSNGFNFTGVNPTMYATGTLLFNGDFSLGARAGGLFVVKDTGAYSWSSSTAYNATPDVYLYRDAAATLAQRNGVNAQSFRVYNTYTDASNYERLNILWGSSVAQIYCDKAGTGTTRSLTFGGGFTGDSLVELNPTGGNGIRFGKAGAYQWQLTSAGNFLPVADATYNIGASGNSVLQIFLSKTVTAGGTTGAQTINKASGSVNFAAAATSLVVTNSLVTTSSVIIATVATNDTTMKTVTAVAAAGSFTLFANAAATAETRVNFIITN